MKTISTLKLFFLLAFNFLITSFTTYAQMTKWYVTPKVVAVSSGAGTPSVSTLVGATATASQVANSIYEPNGTLSFYIADGTFYNISHTALTGTGIGSTLHTTEIAVVPFNCEGGKYHVFHLTANVLTGMEWRYSIVDMTSGSGTVNYVSTVATFYGGGAAGIAVGDVTVGGERYVYAVSGQSTAGVGDVKRITINADNTLNAATSIVTGGTTSGFGSVYFDCVEADLSNDGTKLTWASLYSDKAYVISLTSSGNYGGTVSTYTTGSSTSTFGRGVEFNAAGTELYVGAGAAGIKRVTLSGGAVNSVTGTGSYGSSQLEKGSNGFIYALHNSSNLIIGINPSTYALTSTATTQRPFENAYNILTLPDQIDGFNYGNAPALFNVATHNATSGTWISGTNPWSASIVRIKTALNVGTGVTLYIQNMVVEFGNGATLNISNGGRVVLENATLRSACPLNMWQGVVVTGTGKFMMDDYTNNNQGSEIYDAIRGVDATGTSAEIDIIDNSLFDANEKHVFISNGSTGINTFTESTYSHTTALKDQTKGKDQSGGTTGTRYGITSIQVENSSNDQIIGLTGAGNTFNEGQYGVYAYNADVDIRNNIFNTIRTRGVFADGQYFSGGRNVNVILGNDFNYCKTAIDAHYGVNLTVTANTFDNGTEHGITWGYNPDRTLIIGDESNSALGNIFTAQNWSSVFASDNADRGTDIIIGYNTIQTSTFADGIYVQESVTPTEQTYGKMHIVENDINQIGDGIVVTNVWGLSGLPHYDSQIPADPTTTFKINNNDVDFSTTYGSGKSGIKVNQCRYVRSRFNNLATTSYSAWGNRGIYYIDSRYSLIEKNYSKAAAGIELTGDMLESNIDCNTLDYCVAGIELSNNTLRTPPAVHGVVAGYNRINYFSNTSAYDIDLFGSQPNNNKWVTPNTTNINYNPFTGNIIVAGGSNVCSSLAPYETLTGGEETYKQETSGEEDERDPYWFDNLPAEQEKWTFIYHDQAEHNANEDGLVITDNAFIHGILRVEALISKGSLDTAQEILNGLTPVHPFEINLKDVYDVVLAYRPEEPRKLTEDEINILVAVAEQNTWDGGPATHSARAILKYKENMEFDNQIPGPVYTDGSFKTTPKLALTADQSFAAYPVPAKDMLTLTSAIDGITYYKVVSLDGRLVMQGNFTGRIDLNTNNLGAGSYSLLLMDNQGVVLYRKLIAKQ